jgi:hypothetical protein
VRGGARTPGTARGPRLAEVLQREDPALLHLLRWKNLVEGHVPHRHTLPNITTDGGHKSRVCDVCAQSNRANSDSMHNQKAHKVKKNVAKNSNRKNLPMNSLWNVLTSIHSSAFYDSENCAKVSSHHAMYLYKF